MRIRAKIVVTVLPLLVVTLVLSAVTSSLSARSGITRVALEFLSFKANDLKRYMDSQWSILTSNDLTSDRAFLEVSRESVASYAQTLVRSETERIFALDEDAELVMSTGAIEITSRERERLRDLVADSGGSWLETSVAGVPRVLQSFRHDGYGWSVFVTEEQAAFYREVNEISFQNLAILGVSCAIALALLFVFSGYITGPLTRMVGVMRRIISANDLSGRVPVEYRDETGDLGHTFNIMVAQLETAYSSIKNHAYRALLARYQEQEIRNIFQKYVPKEVIDRIFLNPESMLVGENRPLAVLFSDIRSFTALAEGLPPDEVVDSLNRYFSRMVEIIMRRTGIVDKYIGDAIMAFYGAPVQHPDDALQAVLSALDMLDSLQEFNREQISRSHPAFSVGIGIAYGIVTVGNIGSERKMDYTVIGDMVNLASRLESLTKLYRVPLLFTEACYLGARDAMPCRLIDRVVVKGRKQGEPIYTASRALSSRESKAWEEHARGMELYQAQDFARAAEAFRFARQFQPEDTVAAIYLERCARYTRSPPPADWTGVEVMEEK